MYIFAIFYLYFLNNYCSSCMFLLSFTCIFFKLLNFMYIFAIFYLHFLQIIEFYEYFCYVFTCILFVVESLASISISTISPGVEFNINQSIIKNLLFY